MAFSPLEDGEGGSGCWVPYPVCGFLRPSQEEKVVAPTWGDGGEGRRKKIPWRG